jgi:hypothetical protein
MANHSPRTSAQTIPESFDMMAYTGRAFDLACTLETLRAAMPEDRDEDRLPIAYMVGMLAGQAKALADLLFELPLELVAPSKQGGAR